MKIKKVLFLLCVVSLVMSMLVPVASAVDIINSQNARAINGTTTVTDMISTDHLQASKIENNYDGSTNIVQYSNYPSEGHMFILLEITISGFGTGLFGDDYYLHIDGQDHPRIAEDSFLVNYDYTPIRHGEIIASTEGWLIFEVPESTNVDNYEAWSLINGEESVSVNKNDTDHEINQQDYNGISSNQEELERLYAEVVATGNYDLENPLIIVNPYEIAPQSALVFFSTEEPAKITSTIRGKTEYADVTYSTDEWKTQHEIPLIGLYSGSNTVYLEVEYENGGVDSKTLEVETDPLPDYMQSSFNVISVDYQPLSSNLFIAKDKYSTLFDVNGDIRGYFTIESRVSGLDELTDEGHLFFAVDAYTNESVIYEVDYLGRVYWEGAAITDAHHDVCILDNGNLLTMEDEIDYSTGKIVGTPNKPGQYWSWLFNKEHGSFEYRSWQDKVDWLHINTIVNAGDGCVMVSARNQHAIVKYDYNTKEVKWVLSVNKDACLDYQDKYLTVTDEENFEWFYSQHDVEVLPDLDNNPDTVDITVFDNGMQRTMDVSQNFEPDDLYSRMVHYRINEVEMTVEQIWDYSTLGVIPVSSVYGSTMYIPETGNYLGNFYVSDTETYFIEANADGEVVLQIQYDQPSYRVKEVTSELLYSCWDGIGNFDGRYFYNGSTVTPYDDTRTYSTGTVEYAFSKISCTQDYLQVAGWAAVENAYESKYQAPYLMLRNQATGELYNYALSLNAAEKYNTDTSQEIVDQLDDTTGFRGKFLSVRGLQDGLYDIILVVRNENGTYKTTCQQSLRIGKAPGEQVTTDDILQEQKTVNLSLQAISDSGMYTIQDPYVFVDPYGISPLSAVALFSTSKPATISVDIESKNGAAAVHQDFTTMATEHQIPIYGLYANEATQVTLTANYEDGSNESKTLTVTGNALPADFVPATVLQADTAQMANGWTFFMAGSLQGYVYAIDEAGSVRWMLSEKGLGAASVFQPLENGNYLVGGDKSFGQYYKYSLFELNLSGQIVHEYLIDGYHHDVLELPTGNLLILANNIDGDVVEDTLYELDRNTGAILHTWDFNSYFNVGNYNEAGDHVSDLNYGGDDLDWLHLNGLAYDEGTNSVVLSSRHQDAVFSMDLDTGEINWILSDPNDLWPEYLKEKLLTPTGADFEWQYGQHNVSLLPNGDLLLFDNGDYRSKTAEGVLDAATESYSRAVVYRIDETAMTVTQLWQFGKEFGPTTFAAYVSSAQYLAENHYLIDFGGIVKNANGEATYNIMDGISGSSQSQVYEVKDGEIIFHAEIDRSGLHGNTFRAIRLMPYLSTQELDLETDATRVGSLYSFGKTSAVSFAPDYAITGGPDTSIMDNGVQLTISIDLGQSQAPESMALVFYNEQSAYQLNLSGGTVVTEQINKSEVPAGTYELYLVQDGVVYDLALQWTNSMDARPFPTGYEIEVTTSSADKGVVYGSGTYYANTPFTVWAKPNSNAEFVGWYSNGTLLSTEQTYTLTATQDMTLTATFADGESGSGGGGSTGGGGGSSTGGGSETETVTNPDGSTTTTVTNSDGSKTQTTKSPNGASSVVNTDKNGKVEAEVTLPGNIVTEAAAAGEAVALPMPALSVTKDKDNAPIVTVKLPSGTTATVEIPVENVTPGTVAMLVNADGTENVIKTTATTENGVIVSLSNGQTVKIVDNSKSFADVPSGFWGADAIAFVTSRELFSGTGENTFAPNAYMSRAMIVTVLARLEGVDTTTGSTWYEAGRQWAMEAGISDGTNMEGNLTREQLATMLYRYAGEPAVSGTITGFGDVSDISQWASDAMTWAVNNGIINGTNGMLNPQGLATRVQVAAMLQRFIVNVMQ